MLCSGNLFVRITLHTLIDWLTGLVVSVPFRSGSYTHVTHAHAHLQANEWVIVDLISLMLNIIVGSLRPADYYYYCQSMHINDCGCTRCAAAITTSRTVYVRRFSWHLAKYPLSVTKAKKWIFLIFWRDLTDEQTLKNHEIPIPLRNE